jgi:hypothetical protein
MHDLWCLGLLTVDILYSYWIDRTTSSPKLRFYASLAWLWLACGSVAGIPVQAPVYHVADGVASLKTCRFFWEAEDLGIKHCFVPGILHRHRPAHDYHAVTAEQPSDTKELIVRAHFFLKGVVFNGTTHVCLSLTLTTCSLGLLWPAPLAERETTEQE